ncbi:MAG: hypothetical protein M1820_008469 [Bogoriella megaspora]|nr:MAG: hypothetical protein M1820_008469 [Bogoriella megaspora]
MDEILIEHFRASLPASLRGYCEEQLKSIIAPPHGFVELFRNPVAQTLFGNNEVDSNQEISETTWAISIHSRLQIALEKKLLNGLESDYGGSDQYTRRQHLIFVIGLASLYAFIQSNVTGPPLLSYNPDIIFSPLNGALGTVTQIREQLTKSLGEDGIAAFELTHNVELLCLAETIFSYPAILRDIPAARWAKLRVGFIRQRLLSEASPSIQRTIYEDLDLLHKRILESEPASQRTKVEFLLERAAIHTYHDFEKLAREDLEEAKHLRGFEYALTGRMGKRTKFQEKDLSQLVVLAKSADSDCATSNANGIGNGIRSDQDVGQTVVDRKPKQIDLDDDTLLNSISFNKSSEPSIVAETDLPPILASLDPSEQPILHPLDSILLLSLASSISNTSPTDGLTREETLPYAVCVLDGGSSNWQVYTQALLVRSRIEGYKSRTMERGLLQLQALVDQVIAETTGQGSDQPSVETQSSNGTTTFLPRPKENESAPATERLRYVFQLSTPFRWELEAELAAKWVSMGGLRTALEIYERLNMWSEAALCWAATDKEDKAKQIVRRQLFHASKDRDPDPSDKDELAAEEWTGSARDPPPPNAPRLYCILGDIDRDPAMWEKAWEVSNQRYARAQRSLGKYYFSAKDFAKAALAYNKSLGVNQLNQTSWFAVGCALLQLEQYDRAADAFTRTVQLDDTDAEAWTNLASALLHRTTSPQTMSTGSISIDDEAPSQNKPDPQRNKLDALKALQRAAALKHESPMIWENLLTISASLSPPSYSDIIRAMNRVIAIRSPSLGEKAIDEDILDLLVNHVIHSEDRYDASKPGMSRFVVELVDKAVVPLITSSARLWKIVAKLALWRGKLGTALEAQEKAWRVVTGKPGWEYGTEQQWKEVVDATIDLCDAYESLGPRERTEGLGAGEEVVAKDWKFKARSAVRGIAGKGKESWEGTGPWERLKEKGDELRNS